MGRGKFKGKPTGRRQFSTPEEMRKFFFIDLYLFYFIVLISHVSLITEISCLIFCPLVTN